jgi:hypothetical protein
MTARAFAGPDMVAIQLITDEGAFVCNVDRRDMAAMAVKESGTFVTIYHAIRVDSMFEDRYETHRSKTIETSSIAFYQSFSGKWAHRMGSLSQRLM